MDFIKAKAMVSNLNYKIRKGTIKGSYFYISYKEGEFYLERYNDRY